MSVDEIILGIDLGTTFSAAAYVDEHGRPQIIRNAEGEKTTPSVVLVEAGQLLVGAVAANQAIARRDHVIQWIKRAMGESDYRFQGFSPVEISAAILKKIRADCELELGIPLHKAVITCPAYFSSVEVENTMKAGELAGLDVPEVVREPTAAAVYYGVEHLHEGGKLLVCDLGGGTYDASILSLENGVFKPLATAGDRQLGGHDWTYDLLEYVAEQLREQFGEDPRSDSAVEQTLYDACERVKRDFARSEQGVIPCVFKGQSTQVVVTRAEFEQLTEWRIQQLVTWTEKSLEKADPPLTWHDLDHILLVGGATRMRRVAEALAGVSGQQPIQTAEADTMVALGAAILAKGAYRPRRAVTSGLKLINFQRTAPRNLGTRVIVRDGRDLCIENSIIIPYGAELPTAQTRDDYQISAAGQPFFDVPVVEFDDIGPDVIQDTWRFTCPMGLPQGVPIHVAFHYDVNGRIDVTAVEQHGQMTLDKVRIEYEEPDLDVVRASMSAPRQVVFALDISGSMQAFGKLARARQAVLDNARQLLAAGGGLTQVGVVAFGSQAQVICPLTTDMGQVETAVAGVAPYGTTAMGHALTLALKMLAASGDGVQCEIVLVSDGMPDQPAEAIDAGMRVQTEGVGLSLLGIGQQDVNEAFLKDMSANYLMIDTAGDIGQAITTLLTRRSPPPQPRQAGITWLGGKS